MSEYDLHSLILACDFRVDDVERMWKWLKKHRDRLASIGAHHVVLYTSIWEPGRVLVTIGIRQARLDSRRIALPRDIRMVRYFRRRRHSADIRR